MCLNISLTVVTLQPILSVILIDIFYVLFFRATISAYCLPGCPSVTAIQFFVNFMLHFIDK